MAGICVPETMRYNGNGFQNDGTPFSDASCDENIPPTWSTSGGRDWIKNGDAWRVTARHPDGSLTITRLGPGTGTVTLPAAYAAAHVELLYATTGHRSQGSTVNTAHPLITPGMSREQPLRRPQPRPPRHHPVRGHPRAAAPEPDEQLDRVRHDPRMYAAREILTAS